MDARQLVEQARERQRARAIGGLVLARDNAELTLAELERVAEPVEEGRRLLDLSIERQQLSARSYVRVLRIARTLADLDDVDRVRAEHVGEALRFRWNDLAEL